MARVVLLTGSNLGDRNALLAEARERIVAEIGPVMQESAVYESAPWGFEAEESFLNQAVIVDTNLEPLLLLDRIQQIENEMGRRRTGQSAGKTRNYESRSIDIDILFYDDLILNHPRLIIPHPLLHLREFVLVPLREVMPDSIHPISGKLIRDL